MIDPWTGDLHTEDTLTTLKEKDPAFYGELEKRLLKVEGPEQAIQDLAENVSYGEVSRSYLNMMKDELLKREQRRLR